jgi:hypothetical protein
MSEAHRPEQPRKGDGCLAGLLIIAGIVLLFPGLCTRLFFGHDLFKPNVPLPQPVVIMFGLGLVGTALIVVGFVMTVLRLLPPRRNRPTTLLVILAGIVVGIFAMMLILSAVMNR